MNGQRNRHQVLGTGDLVRAFVDGDVEALDELMRRHRHVPICAARRQLRTEGEADDVAQETWLRFTRGAADIREPERLAGWLRVTAANEARRRSRRKRWQQLVDGFDTVPADQPGDEAFATPERRRAVHRAAKARLNDRERELVALLLDARDLDYQRISRSWLRPVGAIGPTRARIIRKLQSDADVARLREAGA